MNEQIGSVAGAIWEVLEAKGEMSLAQLKKEVKGKPPVFDWGLGWLAREDKILIAPDKRSFRIRLK
ncbi:MAG: winged helix-turn-helix domain-containing protein [Acidobacteria bacterium]|nr:winged helix-turn-helix domain-containing protein [Acidobacteriota bacterium]